MIALITGTGLKFFAFILFFKGDTYPCLLCSVDRQTVASCHLCKPSPARGRGSRGCTKGSVSVTRCLDAERCSSLRKVRAGSGAAALPAASPGLSSPPAAGTSPPWCRLSSPRDAGSLESPGTMNFYFAVVLGLEQIFLQGFRCLAKSKYHLCCSPVSHAGAPS